MFGASRSDVVEGCLLLERRMDITANNLANITTSGFKRDYTSFREVLLKTADGQEARARMTSVDTDFAPGDTQFTGNTLDVALGGPGFFKVQTPEGTFYTRNGRFAINGDDMLVTSEGYPVLGQGGPITIGGANVDVNEAGGISMDQDGDGRMVEVDRLNVVNFEDPSVLEKTGNSLYRLKESGGREVPAEGTQVRKGYLERSNVNVVEEMVRMIQIQRDYESYRKVIQFMDDIDTRMINEVGKLNA